MFRVLLSVGKPQIQLRQVRERSPMPEGLIRGAVELCDLLTFILAGTR